MTKKLFAGKIMAGLVGVLLLGFGAAAHAASCPAAPPAQIAFEAVPSPLTQDTSATAKDLALKAGATGTDRRTPGFYDASVGFTAKRDAAIAKLPDGTVCASLAKLTVKLSLDRKLWLANELTDNACVLKAFADEIGGQAKADDQAVAQFQTVVPTYQPQVAAIGWQTAKSQDAAMQAIADKAAPIMQALQAKFVEIRAAAQSKVDLSKLPAEDCDGAMAKIAPKVVTVTPAPKK
ncbi:hypothetical protein GCM10011611_04880 [Aliidongia dinghuensis]|uniref:DUF2884 family protein n=1 Tax=Aliidongia dinghuensis TaxID=1867774 RepID=A0A8J2YP19_9PROT|nr:hypothetical protein [Aliidongia dinghuensis]GGF02413.1 hypothetical protein GCM10011611_04880 [Aliidongia dinghuensis]